MRVVKADKNRYPDDAADTPDLNNVFDHSTDSKLSVCQKKTRNRGLRWGTKIKKNPDKNNNNSDREILAGGFVQTNPPFNLLAQTNL